MSQGAQDRKWTVQVYEVDDVGNGFFNRDAVREAMDEVEAIGHRMGGAFMLVPVREQDGNGAWHTVRWQFMWQSFVPGRRAQPAEPEPEQEPEVEPEPSESEAAEVAA